MFLRALFILLMFPALTYAGPELITSEVTPLKATENQICETKLKYMDYRLQTMIITADIYRRKLKELGWNCMPKGSEIHCITDEGKNLKGRE